MSGKPKIPGRKETRGGLRESNPGGRPKGVIETKPRKPKSTTVAVLPTEYLRKRWKKAANKFKKEYNNDPEYYMLSLLRDPEVTPGQKLAIFKEYTATFKDPVIPIAQNSTSLNLQQNFLGSPELLEEHPGSAVALPKLDSDMKPADVIEIKNKEIPEGQE